VPLLLLLAVVLVRCAWQSDDAFITFRTVWNLWHGHGLRWNTAERVQSFTHPLWMMVAAGCYGLTHELYFSTLAVSVGLTLATAGVLALTAERPAFGALAVVLFAASGAAIDYAASGLENPLLYLLLALYGVELKRGRASLVGLGLLGSLVALTRLDALLVVGPGLAYRLWTAPSRRRAALECALGFLPLVAWEAFSLAYYGFLVPNTAFAKLNVHIPRGALAKQGVVYLLDSLVYDPLTLLTLVAGVGVGLRAGGRARAVAVGVGLYLAYVVSIGGDFMSGRFLSALVVAAVPLLETASLLQPGRNSLTAAILVGALTLGSSSSRWRSGSDFGRDATFFTAVRETGISDERAYYYQHTGLLPVLAGLDGVRPVPPYRLSLSGRALAEQKRTFVDADELGFLGYFGGPDLYIMDVFALCDPLLARLPFEVAPGGVWRVGHYERKVPQGYPETLQSGKNQIADPALAAYYDRLSLVVRGPLWSVARWREIVRLNLERATAPVPPG
jgi:arabinofuranosyltransferase